MATCERHVDNNCHKNMLYVFLLFVQLTVAVSDPVLRNRRAAFDQNQVPGLNNVPKVPLNPNPPNLGAGNPNLAGGIPLNRGGNPLGGNLDNKLLKNIQPVRDFQPKGNQNFQQHALPLNSQGNPVGFDQRNIGAQQGQLPNRKGQQFMLSESPECQEDLARHCNMVLGAKRHNFAVLECLQQDAEMEISETCQHLIYMYKKNLTKDGRFESAGREVCKKALDTYPDCKNEKQENRIPCLIEYMDNITEGSCQQFLIKMATIIFSDYRYVYHFMESCQNDIERLQCGRIDSGVDKQHEQGKTIVCLAGKIGTLEANCRKQVLRIAELQSDDYHLDRPLYYACRTAREVFCDKVHSGGGKLYSGGGKVFECLFKHKSDERMPIECRKMLTLRQQLIAEDVKIEKTFYTACRKNMKELKCIQSHSDVNTDAKRATVLLCLENAMKNNTVLVPQCIEEMTQMRMSLMEDFKISPDIVSNCDVEIQKYCNGGIERGGKTLHCLMNVANPRKTQKGITMSVECKAAMDDLLTEADIGENFKVDRVLMEACGEVLDTECKNTPADKKINCLMDKVESDAMTDDCEDRLLEIQYFLVRDFKLDPTLYKECHKDAQRICHASEAWIETNVPGASNDPMVFPCLYRTMKDNKADLSRGCVHEIKRAMRRRAKSIDLEPEIEENCLADLGAFCSNDKDIEKGGEMACLQDNLESLIEECADAVREFTEDQDEDLDLDTKLMRACTPMIKRFCGELLEHDAEASDVMDCLIDNKHHHEMDKKCAAGVEHHQIIQLKDVKFSHKFREACKKDIQDHCGGGDRNKKTEIVTCLSEYVRFDIIAEVEKTRISPECQQQLRVEVLRRGETIQLDPELKLRCDSDIKNYCSTVQSGNSQVIQCLKDNKSKLSNSCHLLLFKRQQDEAVLGADFLMFRICKPMIKTYCKSVDDAADVMDCLKRNRNMNSFDTKCRALLMKKILEETKDYRLNPSLAKSCSMDIKKFCTDVISGHKEMTDDKEFEGAVINCLKMQYAKKMLSRDCNTEIKTLVMESHMDIDMDPVLMHKCQNEIKHYCRDELETHEREEGAKMRFEPLSTGDKIEECLQQKLELKKIRPDTECGREIVRLIEESHIDINVDPQLRNACQHDLNRYCQETEIGEGRQMSCILGALEDYPKKLTVSCRNLLSKRLALWEYAAKQAPAESLSDLADNVMQSPAKSYLMALLMTIVGVIFIVGLTCGRVLKRVTAENKNK